MTQITVTDAKGNMITLDLDGAMCEIAPGLIRPVQLRQPVEPGTGSLTMPIVAGPTWDELMGTPRPATPIPSARWHGPPPKQRRGRR